MSLLTENQTNSLNKGSISLTIINLSRFKSNPAPDHKQALTMVSETMTGMTAGTTKGRIGLELSKFFGWGVGPKLFQFKFDRSK